VTASPDADPATVTVPLTVTGSADGTSLLSPGSYLQVTIPYPSLAAAFDNVGITDDSDHSPGNFDGYGNSFSAEALADAGIAPGSPVTSGGVTFTWPDVAAGEPDNVVASGQTIAVSGSGSTLGFLGVANNGVASGSGTITYTDGSTQSFTIEYQNWITATPVNADTLVATTSYFNRTTSGAARTPSLFAAAVPLPAGKTIASVTLPDVSSTTVSTSTVSMHIFAIATA
jgi:phage tail protein X